MKRKVWILDLLALVGFVIAFYPRLTGYTLHEWLGLAVGLTLIVHLLQHWRWVKCVSHMLERVKPNQRIKYLLDVMLAVGFLTIILTGLVISSLLNLPLNRYDVWRVVHFASSYVTLAVLVIKIGVHWDWVKCTIRSAFKHPISSVTPVPLTTQHLSRRAFLKDAGLAAVGLLVIGGGMNILLKNTHASVEQNTPDPTQTINPSNPTSIVTSPQAMQTQSNAPAVPLNPTATYTPMPTATPTVVVQTGKVMCNRGCAYPGQCKKYRDNNGNGLCDLGEPIW